MILAFSLLSDSISGFHVNEDANELDGLKADEEVSKEGIDIDMSDDEEPDVGDSFLNEQSPSIATPVETPDLKRKRDDDDFGTPLDESEPTKRIKENDEDTEVFPPPPPPPPPAGDMPEEIQESDDTSAKEETEEERELRLQEEELIRENEEALMMDLDGSLKAEELDSKLNGHLNGNGNGLVIGLTTAKDSMEGVEDTSIKHERKSVLSH